MIEPLKHRIIVQKPEPKTETESGIALIPEMAQQDPIIEGIVLAIGTDSDPDIKKGSKVMFGKHDGTPVDPKYCDGQERCLLITDNQIRCVVG